MAVLCWIIEWTQYSIRLVAVRYMQQVFSWAHQSPRNKRQLDHFSFFAGLTRWQKTDHATQSVTIDRIYIRITAM